MNSKTREKKQVCTQIRFSPIIGLNISIDAISNYICIQKRNEGERFGAFFLPNSFVYSPDAEIQMNNGNGNGKKITKEMANERTDENQWMDEWTEERKRKSEEKWASARGQPKTITTTTTSTEMRGKK